MKKAGVFIGTLVLVACTLLGIMVSQYSESYDFKSKEFGDGVIINGVRCDGLNYDEAARKITREWNSQDILVVGAMDEPLATIS